MRDQASTWKRRPGLRGLAASSPLPALCLAALLGLLGCRAGKPPVLGPEPGTAGSEAAGAALEKGFEKDAVPDPDLSIPGRRFAVCIGVSRYKHLPDLKYAHRDAEDVYDFLISDRGGYAMEDCILLCDTNADLGRVMKKSMESLFTTWMARVQPQDSVFVFYSGHGLPLGRERAFMAAWDTDPDDLYPTGIPMDRIREYLQEMIAAKRVVIVMDTCFSGAVGGKTYLPGGQRLGAFNEASLDRVAVGTGRVILTASTGRQAAHELESLEHGIFTYCLLKGLRGGADVDRDDRVTLSELWLYLQREVPLEAGRRGLRQTPIWKGGQSGEMVLARLRSGSGTPSVADAGENTGSAEAAIWILDGTNLMKQGFYGPALDHFRRALPYLPPEKRDGLEALIEECRILAEKEKRDGVPPEPSGKGGGSGDLAGTLAEADFRSGRRAEDKGLWDVAIAFYSEALAACPEDQRTIVEARLEACRQEQQTDALYNEMMKSFAEAEGHPSSAAYRKVLDGVKVLEELGKGDDYRDLGTVRSIAEGEITGDESRKYFGWGLKARDAGLWLEALQWFEKAREGAGGRYPTEIEKNIGFCRLSLEREVQRQRDGAEGAFAGRRYEEAVAYCNRWLEFDPGSKEGADLKGRAVKGHARALFEAGRFAECLSYCRMAVKDYPGDELLVNLLARSEEENMDEAGRALWDRAVLAEELEAWEEMAANLERGLQAPPGTGFNEHYRPKAEAKLALARVRAYEQFSQEAQAAFAEGQHGRALSAVMRALKYRPEFEPLLKLKEEIEREMHSTEQALYLAAVEQGSLEQVEEIVEARTEDEVKAVERVRAGYAAYLTRFPDGRWSDEVRNALRRLAEKTSGYPVVEGFRFQRAENFSRSGASQIVGVYQHEKTGMEFVLIPGGMFQMGSPPWEEGRYDNEGPQRLIRVKPFLLCRTECTLEGWDRIGGSDRRRRGSPDDLPIDNVSWEDVTEWCKRAGLRLPTEAEWEYACRAGSTTRFCFGNSEASLARYAWYEGNAGRQSHPTALKEHNAFGLYDMHGNLWEWCQDLYRSEQDLKPSVRSVGMADRVWSRINRGGGWNFPAKSCRSANRGWDLPNTRSGVLGFRPARSLDD